MADWNQTRSQIEHSRAKRVCYIELAEQERDRLHTQADNIICKAEGLQDSIGHAQFLVKAKSPMSPSEIDKTFNFYTELIRGL